MDINPERADHTLVMWVHQHEVGEKCCTPGTETSRGLFVLCDGSKFFALLSFCAMDLLKACDEMKEFIEIAQKLVDAWDADPDNYSQLEEGLTALKAALEK